MNNVLDRDGIDGAITNVFVGGNPEHDVRVRAWETGLGVIALYVHETMQHRRAEHANHRLTQHNIRLSRARTVHARSRQAELGMSSAGLAHDDNPSSTTEKA